MNIVLIGAPLSGKGTQAELISKNFNLTHISTGDMFREIMKDYSNLAFTVSSYLKQGKLVPDDITIEVLKERLSRENNLNGILLDGFPRTLNQAENLDKILNVDKVVFLNVELNELLRRIAGRYVCKSCKKTNTVEGEIVPCTYCGGKLTKRPDDTKEKVIIRYKDFIQSTYPIVEYYKKQNKLIEVSGKGNIDSIYNEIEVRLKDND